MSPTGRRYDTTSTEDLTAGGARIPDRAGAARGGRTQSDARRAANCSGEEPLKFCWVPHVCFLSQDKLISISFREASRGQKVAGGNAKWGI
ncbi:hypothetical protein D4764_05G0006880 [Takifugu flavidus]|uniref:Uncharacterized protein n=1 Tax=Takifugu flavidus TaxID=433684 RepID=A0A5C6N1I7_9TELE|nr:hypothetical protein D4764_05G0006880 [Takifugu flavidus]